MPIVVRRVERASGSGSESASQEKYLFVGACWLVDSRVKAEIFRTTDWTRDSGFSPIMFGSATRGLPSDWRADEFTLCWAFCAEPGIQGRESICVSDELYLIRAIMEVGRHRCDLPSRKFSIPLSLLIDFHDLGYTIWHLLVNSHLNPSLHLAWQTLYSYAVIFCAVYQVSTV